VRHGLLRESDCRDETCGAAKIVTPLRVMMDGVDRWGPHSRGGELAEESGSRTHAGPPAAPTGFEVRPPHRERFPSVIWNCEL